MLFIFTMSGSQNEKVKEDELQNNLDNYIVSLMENTKGEVPSWNKENFKGKWNY